MGRTFYIAVIIVSLRFFSKKEQQPDHITSAAYIYLTGYHLIK